MSPQRQRKAQLAQREREILELALRGHRVKQIAYLTHRSEHTIRHQLKAIYRFLGAHDLADALIRALVRGDVQLPAPALRPLDVASLDVAPR